MKNIKIYETAVKLGRTLVDKKETVRGVAKIEKIPKTTVHKYLTDYLKDADLELYEQVRKQLDYNYSVKHIRGGMATKKRYSKTKRI